MKSELLLMTAISLCSSAVFAAPVKTPDQARKVADRKCWGKENVPGHWRATWLKGYWVVTFTPNVELYHGHRLVGAQVTVPVSDSSRAKCSIKIVANN
jgi:hypothetical protein